MPCTPIPSLIASSQVSGSRISHTHSTTTSMVKRTSPPTRATGSLTFTRPDGKVILAEKSGIRPEIREVTISDAPTYEVKQTFSLQPNEAIYGLGQAIRPFLNYRGKEILIVQANIPAYSNVITSSNDYGILWDICSQSIFKDDANGMSIWSENRPSPADADRESIAIIFLSGYFGASLAATFLALSGVTLSPPDNPRYRISCPASRSSVNALSKASSLTQEVLATRPARMDL